jgi:hypothetical protein
MSQLLMSSKLASRSILHSSTTPSSPEPVTLSRLKALQLSLQALAQPPSDISFKEEPSLQAMNSGVGAMSPVNSHSADSFFSEKSFIQIAGDQETAVKYRTAIYLGAASVAEFFADILLTPLEATRIRLVSQKGFATGLVSGFTRIAREGGARELYAGFLPIICK